MKKRILINCSGKKAFNGRLLKSLRSKKPYAPHAKIARGHMSKAQVARKIGVSARQVGRYEQNDQSIDDQEPRLQKLKTLCLMFQVDPKYFLGLEWVDEQVLVDKQPVIDPTLQMEIEKKFCSKCLQLIISNEKEKKEYEKQAKAIALRTKVRRGIKTDATQLLKKRNNNETANEIDARQILAEIQK